MTQLKQRAKALAPFLILFLSLLMPRESAAGVVSGAGLACRAALPALFPALVLSKLISSADLPFGRFLPLILGLCCGFPVGALSVCDLKERGLIDRNGGNRLLFCCCNTGPSFIIGFCGQMILRNVKAGLLLYLAQCLLALILFLILAPRAKLLSPEAKPVSIAFALKEGALGFLQIAACVIFFSFLTSLFFAFLPERWTLVRGIAALFLEITGGMAHLSALPFSTIFTLCAAGIGWAGLSVLTQTAGPVGKAGLDLRWYLAGRVCFTVFLLLLSFPLKKLL